MASTTWLEIVDANVRERGELVIGIDPSLADLPQFFERGDGHWISRYVDFLLDIVETRAGFVKFQSAYFEAGGLAGLSALSAGMKRAKAAYDPQRLAARCCP